MSTTKLKHTFFHTGLAAFISHFSGNIQPYRELLNAPVPVSIVNTGDEVFLSTMLFKTPEQKAALYSHNPRVSFSLGGIGKNTDELTSPYILGKFVEAKDTGFDAAKRAEVRRIPVLINMNYEIVFSNIDQYLKLVDVILTVIEQEQVFEFEYAGTIHRGSYSISSEQYDSTANLALSHDSEKRRRILENSIDLKLQFPAYNVYSTNGSQPEVFDENQKMNALIHSVYFDGDTNLVARNIITKTSTS